MVVRDFERELEKYFDLPKNSVVCTNSGTSALHLALKTLGVGLYHEVILPAQTFIATGLAILYSDAQPVFCDIGYDGNIDPDKIKDKTTFDTKAIIAVNWAGKACDVEKLHEIAKRQNLKLIIDAAQSLGVGMGGDITCLSFQATKHLTTGDGGAVICYNPEDYAIARKLSWFGIDRENDLPDILGERVYNLDFPKGYKYHMNNIAAALGLANLETLDERMKHREKIAGTYWDNLDGAMTLQHWHIHPIGSDAWWAFPIYVDDVKRFSEYCQSVSIPVNIIHRGIDHNKIFGGVDSSLVTQREWEKHVTHLPIHHEITEDMALEICEKVNQYNG
jgi:perosamine synthetase